jgi:hypothetical protein
VLSFDTGSCWEEAINETTALFKACKQASAVSIKLLSTACCHRLPAATPGSNSGYLKPQPKQRMFLCNPDLMQERPALAAVPQAPSMLLHNTQTSEATNTAHTKQNKSLLNSSCQSTSQAR